MHEILEGPPRVSLSLALALELAIIRVQYIPGARDGSSNIYRRYEDYNML